MESLDHARPTMLTFAPASEVGLSPAVHGVPKGTDTETPPRISRAQGRGREGVRSTVEAALRARQASGNGDQKGGNAPGAKRAERCIYLRKSEMELPRWEASIGRGREAKPSLNLTLQLSSPSV